MTTRTCRIIDPFVGKISLFSRGEGAIILKQPLVKNKTIYCEKNKKNVFFYPKIRVVLKKLLNSAVPPPPQAY